MHLNGTFSRPKPSNARHEAWARRRPKNVPMAYPWKQHHHGHVTSTDPDSSHIMVAMHAAQGVYVQAETYT